VIDETDDRPRFIVQIGNHFVAGLGRTYEGYHNGAHIPMVPGIVITRLENHAMEFTSRREAASVARSIGGQVYRV
jgi:hypothetical protein